MENILTIGTFVLFTGLVAVLTWILTRKDDHKSSSGFFLGGRTLTATFIAGSLLLTNLSTEQMVGLNGTAFKDGLSCMVWEVVAVVALVIMALYFLPKFLKSGITTIPQFLEIRYGHSTQVICNTIFMIAYTVILLPIILYTGAKGFDNMLGVKAMTGIESEMTRLYLIVVVVGSIGSIYAMFGGLRTVAVSDTLNGVGLLIGGLLIPILGFAYLSEHFGDNSGIVNGFTVMKEAHSTGFNSIGGAKQGVPFSTIFTGVMLLNLFYWCTNQQIIQRTFGASNLKEGQKGVLITGFLKLLGPLYLVIPGMIAYAIFARINPEVGDKAYGMLVRTVLPWPVRGFFAAVMAGAILSSFNSALNSTTTLFSLGAYRNFFNPDASEDQIVKSGKKFGWIVAGIVIATAPLLLFTEGVGIFGYLQAMNGIYFIPIFAVIIAGLFFKRVPSFAANFSLIAGIVLLMIMNFVPMGKSAEGKAQYFGDVTGIHGFHGLGIVFALLVAFMVIMHFVAPRAEAWKHEYSGDLDMTPWKFAIPLGAVSIVLVFIIYLSLADWSVLKETKESERLVKAKTPVSELKCPPDKVIISALEVVSLPEVPEGKKPDAKVAISALGKVKNVIDAYEGPVTNKEILKEMDRIVKASLEYLGKPATEADVKAMSIRITNIKLSEKAKFDSFFTDFTGKVEKAIEKTKEDLNKKVDETKKDLDKKADDAKSDLEKGKDAINKSLKDLTN